MLGKEVGETVVRVTREPGLVLSANSEVTALLDWLIACAINLVHVHFLAPPSLHACTASSDICTTLGVTI